MIFKFRYRLLGGHVHIRVFAGTNPDALGMAGNLILREDEWDLFKETLMRIPLSLTGGPVLVQFVDETGEGPHTTLPLDLPPGEYDVIPRRRA